MKKINAVELIPTLAEKRKKAWASVAGSHHCSPASETCFIAGTKWFINFLWPHHSIPGITPTSKKGFAPALLN